jgi:hypothetical protein
MSSDLPYWRPPDGAPVWLFIWRLMVSKPVPVCRQSGPYEGIPGVAGSKLFWPPYRGKPLDGRGIAMFSPCG